jgi:hypothetical protein
MRIDGPEVGGAGGSALYQWVVNSDHPCGECDSMDGEIKTMSEWLLSRKPGFHAHCHCSLKLVTGDTDWGQTSGAAGFPEGYDRAHWNSSIANKIIYGDDIYIPSPGVVKARIPSAKFEQIAQPARVSVKPSSYKVTYVKPTVKERKAGETR